MRPPRFPRIDAMLEKLRSRHSIDLPAEGWRRSRGLFVVWGGIAFLFVLVPLLLALYAGARLLPVGIVAAFGALLLALLVGAVRGKPGARRH